MSTEVPEVPGYAKGQPFKELAAGASFSESLKSLLDNRMLCVGCFLEKHAEQREEINLAVLVVGGNSTCLEHIQVQQGPMLPGRTASGLILGQ